MWKFQFCWGSNCRPSVSKPKSPTDAFYILFVLGITHAQKALELDETSGNCHKWYAIHVGLKSDFLQTTEKLQNGLLFFKHLNRALELMPEDHSLFHLRARFSYAVSIILFFPLNP